MFPGEDMTGEVCYVIKHKPHVAPELLHRQANEELFLSSRSLILS